MKLSKPLGKKPPKYDKRDLKLADYIDLATVLPKIPTGIIGFGHEGLIKNDNWEMLANDNVGDCVEAGICHKTMLWTAEGEHPATFTDNNAISLYSAITGYDPTQTDANGNNPTDQGTDVRTALQYWQQTGISDAGGNIHKIGAYIALEPGNYQHILAAMYLFSAVGIGINFPDSAMDQFDTHQTWSVVAGSQIEGGHYVPLVALRFGRLDCITWGKLQQLTPTFFNTYCDEAWAVLSSEMLAQGKSLEGFDLASLQADLQAVTA